MWKFEQTTNLEHYREAFAMYFRPAPFLRATCAWQMSDESEFAEAMSKGLCFAGFIDGKMVAFVHAESKPNEIAEGHLFCLQDTSIELISALVAFAKTEVLKTYKQIVTHIISRHKTLHEVMRRSGFYWTGFYVWNAVYRHQLIESKVYIG